VQKTEAAVAGAGIAGGAAARCLAATGTTIAIADGLYLSILAV